MNETLKNATFEQDATLDIIIDRLEAYLGAACIRRNNAVPSPGGGTSITTR